VVLCVLIGGLMSVVWLPAFSHLRRHPELVKPHLPSAIFALQMLQAAIGILLDKVAAAFGWFVQPVLAVGIFMLVVGYYAWTSQVSRWVDELWQVDLKARIGVYPAGRGGTISAIGYRE
jgi:hypothetical protein